MKKELLQKLFEIKLFLFDLEGVLLQNADSLTETSLLDFIEEIKKAASELEKRNLLMGIVTARQNDELIKKLNGIKNCKVLSGSVEKVKAAEDYLEEIEINFENVFYMGDEVLDIPLLMKCGFSAAPKSAIRDVKRVVNYSFTALNTQNLFDELIFNIDKSRTLSDFRFNP
jgi:3-deoxy-D-manno-octulosonate 8-phosphate phosphatase (KDO 8-P phosphatase)